MSEAELLAQLVLELGRIADTLQASEINAGIRHRELMDIQAEQFRQSEYSAGVLAAYSCGV